MQALPQVILHRPLVSVSTAQAALDRNHVQILRLIEQGQLRAFNLSREIYTRSEVRILAIDIAAYQRSEAMPHKDFQTILHHLFPLVEITKPGVVSKVKLTTVARRLGIHADHATSLVKAGWLRAAQGSKARCGPGGSLELELASVVAFLKKRFIQ